MKSKLDNAANNAKNISPADKIDQEREAQFDGIAGYLDDQIVSLRQQYSEETDIVEKAQLNKEIKQYRAMLDVVVNPEEYVKEDFNNVLSLLEDRIIGLSLSYDLAEDERKQGEELRKNMTVLTAKVYKNDQEPIRSIAEAKIKLKTIEFIYPDSLF